MRSRAARFTIGAGAAIAIGAAAAFLVLSEKHILVDAAAVRAFDLAARGGADARADAGTGQQGYAAAGQGVTFWMPKVAARVDTVTSAISALRQSAATAEARAELDQAAASVTEFADVDARAREYVKSAQLLMAGDVIFTEGNEAAVTAARHVERARLADHQRLDPSQAPMP